MALKNKILAWLGQTPNEDDEKLAEAEADLAEDAYRNAADDVRVDARLGSRPGEFESDQSAPR